MYRELLQIENEYAEQIEMDVPRTFPRMSAFCQEQRQRLRRVLHAYASFNSHIGYCQGMNSVVAVLLLVSQDEEETFWALVGLMDKRRLGGLYEPGFPLLQQYLTAFDTLALEALPDLRAHFASEALDPAVYLHHWFLTLFAGSLPLPMVLSFWDVVICSGREAMLSITVSLLKVLKPALMGQELEFIVQALKTIGVSEGDEWVAAAGQVVVAQSRSITLSESVLELLQVTQSPHGREVGQGNTRRERGMLLEQGLGGASDAGSLSRICGLACTAGGQALRLAAGRPTLLCRFNSTDPTREPWLSPPVKNVFVS